MSGKEASKNVVQVNLTAGQVMYLIAFIFGGGAAALFGGATLGKDIPTQQTVVAATDTVVNALSSAINEAKGERIEMRGRINTLEGRITDLGDELAEADSTNRSGIGALEKLGIRILNELAEQDSTQ